MSCEMKVCIHKDANGNCHLSDCLYIAGGLLNWSHYSRDNIPKPPAKYKVGDTVRFAVDTEILSIGKDCDGTVLYELDMLGHGWSEEFLANRKLLEEVS